MAVKKVTSKGKKVVPYKFVPPTAIIKSNTQAIDKARQEHDVMKAVVKGHSFEEIAARMGLDDGEAVRIYRAAIKRWGTELAQTANEAKALDLARYDKMLLVLHPLIFPEPTIVDGVMTMPKPDYVAMKLALDIMDKRAKIHGYEAKDKLEQEQHEILKRMYVGAQTNEQGEIDL